MDARPKRMAIIASKGALDMAYPPLILASTAAALDYAKRELDDGAATVAEVAARSGFRSATTFSLEYRKRFGHSPSHAKRAAKS